MKVSVIEGKCMEYREQIKSLDEYAEDLLYVAPLDVLKAYMLCLEEKDKVGVIKILRQYKVILKHLDL